MIINKFAEKGFLVSPELLNKLPDDFDSERFFKLIKERIKSKDKPLVLNEDLFLILTELKENIADINWFEFEKSKTYLEKKKDVKTYYTFLDILNYNIDDEKKQILDGILEDISKPVNVTPVLSEDKSARVIILKNYQETLKKREIQDFVEYFKKRYEFFKNILKSRQELTNLTSINRVSKEERKEVSIIGIVSDKRVTKNNNIILTLEDLSGKVNVLVSQGKEIYEIAKDIVLDEVIGVKGVTGFNIIFANNILFPDIPNKEIKKAEEEEYVIFTSDLHVGNKFFLKKEFIRFVKWLNGEEGSSKQMEIAKNVKYLFIIGDLVDGIGVYPDQEDDLEIKDIYEQYEECARLLSLIRDDIKIIICAGNHDASRISEPQPILDKNIAKSLYELKNVFMATNPSLVNIGSSEIFSGFDVLIYHGYSFPYLAENVDSVRVNGRLERADLIMKFILQRRHLAPSYGSSLYIPEIREDPLVIDKIPDFFVTGHIHKTSCINYKNITAIGSGCWITQTEDQARRGIIPDPGRVTLVNLKTRDIKILNFRE